MTIKTVFVTEGEDDLECYIEDGKLNIWIGDVNAELPSSGHITLDKENVGKFIKVLQDLESQLPN